MAHENGATESNGKALTASCGAKTRKGTPCRQPQGFRTETPGKGRCWLHRGRPITHGRYSKIHRESLRTLAEGFENDPDPLNVLPELAQTRALYTDWLNRCDDPDDPTEFDPKTSGTLLDLVSKAVKRIEDVRAKTAVSQSEFYRFLHDMGRAVDVIVTDPEERRLVQEAWLKIPLPR